MTKNPRWGAENRDTKALAILQTLKHFSPANLSELNCVDIGCGSGGIAFHLAPYVKNMTGVDPEPWARWRDFANSAENLSFLQESVDSLTLRDESIDLVICNQVYEHVPDAKLLINEIFRVLKPGGCCYFAGPNLLFPIEPHVFWPFVHWIPRKLAVRIMHFFGSKSILDAYSTDYWRLKNMLSAFEIINAIPYHLKNPDLFERNGLVWRLLSKSPQPVLEILTPISPGFIFILKK